MTNRFRSHILTLSCAALLVSGAFGLATNPATAVVNTHGQPPISAWVPANGQPKFVLLCVHGLGLHSGSFADLGQKMQKDGVAVYSIDARGFGQWFTHGESKVDFDATLKDIANVRELIAKEHPDIPIFILGESMGGAIALQAASKYPDKFNGLICAVPSGDRFGDLNVDLHLGFKVLTKGFDERFDVGTAVIKHATQKSEEHRKKWSEDPLARKQFSVGELLGFQQFMNKNFDAARKLHEMPVLFVQGANDHLVHPGGTWDVFKDVTSPRRDMVVSTSSEHLIFENGQFTPNDVKFVSDWVNKILTTPAVEIATTQQKPKTDLADSAPSIIKSAENLTYWIELKRDGKLFRCNNKTQFQSGDEIRFHVRCGTSGYAYIMMQQGSGGGKAMLFPDQRTGTNNSIRAGQDCAIPTLTYLRFDDKPGTEKVSVVFSKRPINIDNVLKDPNTITAYVSPDRSGAKDLVPTRMQLSWDDPNPVLMPQHVPDTGLASHSSLVTVGCSEQDTVALDIALEHK